MTTDQALRLLTIHFNCLCRSKKPQVMECQAAVEALRAALAPESGGREPALVTCGMYRHGAGDGLVHVLQADCHNPKPAPSSPSSAQGEVA